MKPLRIVIVDDHPLFRHGVRTLFSTTPDLEVVGEAANGQEAACCRQTRGNASGSRIPQGFSSLKQVPHEFNA
jgi:DNA-binding LytR/AlgR family response regulator